MRDSEHIRPVVETYKQGADRISKALIKAHMDKPKETSRNKGIKNHA